jgi:small subunit ribosomal protein S6
VSAPSEGRYDTVKKYEAIYIMDPALPDEDQTAMMERLQRLIADQGGTVDKVDKWERRRLAYEIKGRREGVYVVMNFTGAPACARELERVMGLADNVLRGMIVGVEEKTTKEKPKTEEVAVAS